MNNWETKKRAVTLTNAQWSHLTTYILMTTKYREGEREAWEKLSKETNEDGTPAFESAASNAEFWGKIIADLDTIRKTIDGRI